MRSGCADICSPARLAREGIVASEDVQVPEGHAGGHAGAVREADRGRELEQAEVGRFLRAEAHADEFDFSHDETVSAAVVTHALLQV